MTMHARRVLSVLAVAGLAFALPACGMLSGGDQSYPEKSGGRDHPTYSSGDAKRGTGYDDDDDKGFVLFGKGGLFGGKKDDDVAALPGDPGAPQLPQLGGGGVAVNPFLWRASLDTISFMPLASADPFGGVIITDWYSDPQAANERFKITIYILDQTLRADGVRVSVFRQEKDFSGAWKDAGINPDVSAKLENAILVRARELKVATSR